jgi:hypothetical protein
MYRGCWETSTNSVLRLESYFPSEYAESKGVFSCKMTGLIQFIHQITENNVFKKSQSCFHIASALHYWKKTFYVVPRRLSNNTLSPQGQPIIGLRVLQEICCPTVLCHSYCYSDWMISFICRNIPATPTYRVNLSWSDIPELVVSIRISVIEGCC